MLENGSEESARLRLLFAQLIEVGILLVAHDEALIAVKHAETFRHVCEGGVEMNFLSWLSAFPARRGEAVANADKKSITSSAVSVHAAARNMSRSRLWGAKILVPGKVDHRDEREQQRES